MEKEFKLDGKTALVTGALSGIGLETVKLLMKENIKGIMLLDVATNDDLINELKQTHKNTDILYKQCDVTKPQELDDAYTIGWNYFGYIDIGIHSAGIWDETQWRQVIETNVIGVIEGSMWLRNKMRKDRGGRGGVILNLSSMTGINPDMPYCPIYSSSKFAVQIFTSNMGNSIHYKMTGVRFLTICPAVTDTPMIKNWNGVDEEIGAAFRELLHGCPVLPASEVANAIVDMCKKSNSGKVWIWDGQVLKEYLPMGIKTKDI